MPTLAPEHSIALCLSGGGLRATLFHLGLVKALRAHSLNGEMALKRVTEIYSVSGGSILAAHLLRFWDKYIGDGETFSEVERELIAFAQRNVRDRVLRRSGLTVWLGRSSGYWLQKEYESLLGRTTISQCYLDTGSVPSHEATALTPKPQLHILATSFQTGELCSFSGRTFELTRRTGDGFVNHRAPAGQLRLAYAVAASSAFPPMFPPVALTPDMLGRPSNNEFDMSLYLTDGGVYDNFGLEKLRLVERSGPRPGIVIASHASGSFETDLTNTYSAMLSRNIRASDILMRRVGESTLDAVRTGKDFVLVRIGATVDDKTIEVATQQRLRLVRTDLDAFDARLAGLLVDHGCRVASDEFAQRNWAKEGNWTHQIHYQDGDLLDDVARRGADRSWWSLALDLRDGVLLIWLVLAAVLLATFAFVGVKAIQAYSAQAAEARLARSRLDVINQNADWLEEIRSAAAGNDLQAIRQVLRMAIPVTESLAATLVQDAILQPAPVTPQQAEAALAEPPAIQITSDAADHSQLVYIQFAGSLTRAQITALNSALKQANWQAQGASGERTPQAAGLNEVRYSGMNGAAANQLAAAINSAKLTSRPVTTREVAIIRPNVLEAWISR